MSDSAKTREELLTELEEARRLLAVLQQTETARQQAVERLAHKEEEFLLINDELRKEIEQRGRIEESYRAFVEQSAEGIYLMEAARPIPTTLPEDEQIAAYVNTTRLAQSNDTLAQMYGFTSASELIGAKLYTVMPASGPHNVEYLRAFIRAGYRLTDVESHEVDRDGKPKYFLNNLCGVIKDGALHRAWGTQRDITKRKLLEMKLTEVNSNLENEIEERKQIGYELLKSKVNVQTLLDAIPDLLFRMNREGVYLAYRGGNPAALVTTPDKLIGKTVYDILPAELAAQTVACLHRALETETLQTLEYELPAGDSMRCYEARIVANGAEEALAIVRDITDSKLAEEHLRESEERYRILYENNPLMVFTVAADGTMLSVNEPGAQQLGYRALELTGESVFRLFHEDDRAAVRRQLAECIQAGSQISQCEIRKRRKDGETIWVSETARAIKTPNRESAILIVCEDITWRKRADDALRESEEKFSKAVNLSPHAIGIVSLNDHRYLYLNEMVLTTMEYSREELIGRSIFEVRFWADEEENDKLIRLFLHNPTLRDVQLKVSSKSGVPYYALVSTEPITIGGEPCLLITGNDITGRVKAEKALKDSEERFQSLANNSPVGIYRLDNDGNCLYVNNRWSEIAGVGKTAAYGHGWMKPIHPDDFKAVMAKAADAAAKGAGFKDEYRVRRPDGDIVWVYNQAGPERNAAGEIIGYVGTLSDITERKLAEEALKQSERRFQNLAKSSPAGIFRCDLDGRGLYFNEQCCEITGLKTEEISELNWFSIIPPDDREKLKKKASQAIQAGQVMKDEHRLKRPDGSIVWVYGQALPERNEAGDIIGIVGTLTDITERKLAEEALRESEQRYRTLFERNLAGVYRGALSGRILEINDAYAQIFGFTSRQEILALTAFDLFFTPAERDDYTALLREQGHLTNHELCLRKSDGAAVWVLVNAAFIPGDSDETTLIEETLFDITDRKLAEEALRDSEARFRVVAESSPGAIMLYDKRHFVYVNPAATIITGYAPEELLQLSPWDIIDSEYEETANRRWLERQQGVPVTTTLEYKIHTRNGEERWVAFNAGEFISYQGRQVATATAYDITERKQAETALRESENRFRTLAETASDAIITIDEHSHMVFVNPAAEAIFGYTQAEMLNASLTLLMPENLRQQHKESFKRYHQTGNRHLDWRRVELPGLHKDGREIPLELSFGEFTRDQKQFITGIARDITERKRAEDALRDSEAKFRSVAETSPCAIAIAENNLFVYVNPALETITGYSSEELLNRNSLDFLALDQQDIIKQRIEAREQGSPIPNSVETKITTKNGEERWIEYTSGGDINYQGRKATIGTAFDITARKHAETMLAAEKERLAVTLRSIGDGVIATDTTGSIVLLNRVAENLTGWKQEEAVGKPLADVFHIINEKTREQCENPVEKALRTGQNISLANHTVLIAKDGAERPIADSGSPIYDRDSRIIGVVLVFRDMTEELQREAELLRASKLESIGLLAGGIAHDFNNILTAILGNVSLAKRLVSSEHAAYRRLSETEQATMRARDLTQQLLTFARGGAPIKKTAAIGALLQEAVPFALAGSNVQSELRIPEHLWLTDIDEGQINQVLHNLILNARQAMPIGGQISVRAENIVFSEDTRIQGARLPAGNYIKITVSDSGVGIPEDYISRIFDPYFTTKQKGSGLGLATSYSIVKNHGGFIFVESKPGSGTTFELYFPASGNQALDNQQATEKALFGKGKILVMDDEETIRDMVSDMLAYLGYEAGVARHGEEAIQMYVEARQSGQPFDAMLMDLTVPGGMGGEEAVRRLLAIDPKARCIVSSGYSTAPIMAEYKKYGFVAVIAKPFQIVQLNEVLHKVLQGASEAP